MEFEEKFDNETEDVLDEVVEEPEEEESEDIASLDEPAEEPQPKATEPGYVKGRIEKAVQKALEQQRETLRAEMEAQYAPIKERLFEMDAQELVRKGEVKSIEVARELVRARQGVPHETPKGESSNDDPATSARIEMLQHQRQRIIEERGVDPAELFNSDEETRNKVIRGEMDFYDVAKNMKPKKRPPSPQRSPNGASGKNSNAIDSMSDEQFEKMERNIKKGARYALR